MDWWPKKFFGMILELNEMREMPCEELGEERYLGSRNSMYKGPMVGAGLAYLRNSEKASDCKGTSGVSEVREMGRTRFYRAVQPVVGLWVLFQA